MNQPTCPLNRGKLRVPDGVNSANLGWMSEQWLAEHRASHSL